MPEPRRYQRKRNVSADIPLDAIYVGRPTKWGNPYKVGTPCTEGPGVMDARLAVVLFHMEVMAPDNAEKRELIRKELRGKDLVCWCPLDQPCHADVLLELANK